MSNRKSTFLAAFFVLLFFQACKKEEIISGNEPPPDQTIENVTISNYVNRVYVSVLGREATSSEKTTGFDLLRQNNLSMDSRIQFLDQVFASSEYRPHLYDFARTELLNNLDTSAITEYLAIYHFLRSDITYQIYWDIIDYEIERLDSLQRVPDDLVNNRIDITYLHRRCVNNYFYDQINMGTENFVVSCFQHFLDRYPGTYELSEGKKMVDGTPAILFLESGQSKDDFISIFFSSQDYFEGLAINLYKRYLLRSPTSIEMGNAAQAFAVSHNYIEMQEAILSTNEYIGIE